MVKVKSRSLLLAKKETTYGSDPTPTVASNSLVVEDLNIKETFEAQERGAMIASLSKKQSVSGMRFAEVTFKTPILGSGAAGTAPRLGALFQACAMSESVAASSVTYTVSSSPISSCTLYLYHDGTRHIIKGCVGSFKLAAEAGKTADLEFSFKGVYADPTDTALPTVSSGNFESTHETPPVMKSASFNYNSISSLLINAIELDLANTVAMRQSINATYGIGGFHITDRRPNLSIDPESELITTIDWRGDVLNTARAVTFSVGATSGNKCDFSIPNFLAESIEYGDREGILVETVKGGIYADSDQGNDELVLTFN